MHTAELPLQELTTFNSSETGFTALLMWRSPFSATPKHNHGQNQFNALSTLYESRRCLGCTAPTLTTKITLHHRNSQPANQA